MEIFARRIAALVPRVLGLAALAAGLPLLMSVSARADTVNFADTTDTVLGTTTGSRASIDSVMGNQLCGLQTVTLGGQTIAAEGCFASITAPAALATLNGGDHLYLVNEGGVVSDAIAVTQVLGTVHVVFLSDASVAGQEPGLPLTCAAFAGLCTTIGEVGTIPVNWSTGTKDTVTFQSDAPGVVPEPATLTLLGSGLLAIGGFVRKRLA
jgi:hypothetical protein